MVFTSEIDPQTKAFVKFLLENDHVTVKEISKRCRNLRASVYRCLKGGKMTSKKKSPARPREITPREERIIHRNVQQLRNTEGTFTVNRLRDECGFHTVPLCTINRTLKRMNYKFCEARRKGVLTKRDQLRRVKFARDVLNKHSPQLWTDEICFYLDGASFWYKTNPVVEAKTPRGKIWRKRNEGLNPLCTAKGCHTGSGGKVAKMFVAICYGKGVIFC